MVEFIGRDGSRKEPIEKLKQFSQAPEHNGIFQVWGFCEIGKTEVIKKALEEIENDHGANVKVHRVNINKKSTCRFSWQTTINDAIRNWGKKSKIIVIYPYSDNTEIELDLQSIFNTRKDAPTLKIIIERQKPFIISNKPYLAVKDSNIPAFEKNEVDEFVASINRNESLIQGQEEVVQLSEAIYQYCGRHPGLLTILCMFIKAYKQQISYYYDSTDYIEHILDMDFEKSFKVYIMKIFESLSKGVQISLFSNQFYSHLELNHNGLTIETSNSQISLIKLMQKFIAHHCKGLNMNFSFEQILGQILINKAANYRIGHGVKTIWEKIFPPDALYVAALKQAENEIRKFWREGEGISEENIPRLDVTGAMKEKFDLTSLDREKIKDDNKYFSDSVKEVLMKHVVGDNNPDGFVGQVIQEAENKFRQAITFEDRRSAALWKEYIIHASDSLKKSQSEILKEISELVELVKVWLQVDKNKVNTMDEIVGSKEDIIENISLKELGLSFPKPAYIEIKVLSKQEFWDSFNDAWGRWWDARDKKRFKEPRKKYYSDTETQRPLNQNEKDEQEEVIAQWKKAVEEMAQAKADLLALAEKAKQIFVE